MDKRIGAQFYTIRDFIKTVEDFDASCKKIVDIGYKIVQISGCPLEAKDMKPILDKYGLQVVLTHKAFKDFDEDLKGVIEYNRTLGCNICGLGSMPGEYMTSKEKLMEFVEKTNSICDTIKKEGMVFAYHNHAREFIKCDGKYVYDYLVEETDPDVFMFTVDTYWCQVAGIDCARLIEKLGKRAVVLHYKDLKVTMENGKSPEMAEVGYGNLDWNLITEAGEKAGSKYAVVEQDICPADPFDSLKMSYDYLTAKGFI